MTKAVAFIYPQHRISVTDNLRSGAASSPNRTFTGVPFQGAEAQTVVTLSLGKPAAAVANNVALSQAINTGTPGVLNGALVSGGVATFDFPRNVVAAWTGAAVLTVTGKDEYGQTMSEASASGTSLVGKKAFKQVTAITVSANVTAFTAGSGSVLGLPFRPVIGGFIRGIMNENTADAGTYAVPERSASTTTTNDVRGTYAPAGTLNATNEFIVAFSVQNGPNDSDAYGIAQA